MQHDGETGRQELVGAKPPPGPPEGTNRPRILGTSLEALIRSARAEAPSTPIIAERVFAQWKALPGSRVRIEATSLHVDDQPALVGTPEEGRWLLPAFMAGLRTICMDEGVFPSDLMRLAAELGRLESTLPSIARFRNWLWADGAEGFEVQLDLTFGEGLDVVFLDVARERNAIAAMRIQAATALSERAADVLSRDLDVAAAREESQVSLDHFAHAASDGLFGPTQADRRSLKTEAEEALHWVDAQVHMTLAYPALAASIPPETLARRLLVLAGKEKGWKLLGLLAAISKRSDAASRSLLETLHRGGLGAAVAGKLVPEPETLDALLAFLETGRSPIGESLLAGLLERAGGEIAASELLDRAVETLGLERFWAALPHAALTETSAATLWKLLMRHKASEAYLSDLLARVAPPAAISILKGQHANVLWRLKERILALLTSSPDGLTSPLIQALLARQDRRLVELMGEAFLVKHGASWGRGSVRAVLAACAANGLGARVLVPIVRARNAAKELRLLALTLLDKDREALAEAVRFNVLDLMDDPDVRAAQKRKRKELDGGRA